MLYVICFYVISVAMIHTLLFTKAKYMSRILLINSAISCMAVAMLLLAYYFKDTNFIDVIFFYIIMSPIGFYGIFIYYKNMAKNNKYKTNEPNKNVILQPKIDIDAILGKKPDNTKQQNNNGLNIKNNAKRKSVSKAQHTNLSTKKTQNKKSSTINNKDKNITIANNNKSSTHKNNTHNKSEKDVKDKDNPVYANIKQKNKL